MFRHERSPLFLWETKLKPRYICSSSLSLLLSQLANFNYSQCTGCLKNYYMCLCWIPVLENCSCSNWAEEIPALRFLYSCPTQGGLRRLGAGLVEGVSLQAAPQVLSTAAHPARALHCSWALALPRGSLLGFQRPAVKLQ